MWYCKFQTQRWHQKPRLGDLTYQVSHKYAFNIFHLRILDFLDSLKTPQISAILNSSPNNRNRPSLPTSSATSSGKQYISRLINILNFVCVLFRGYKSGKCWKCLCYWYRFRNYIWEIINLHLLCVSIE